MVYVTNYKMATFMHNLVIDIPINFEKSFYSHYKLLDLDFIDLKYFSLNEVKKLALYDLLLEKTEWTMRNLQIARRNEEQKRWVYPISLPCYHKDKECEFMQNDFVNISVPKSLASERLEEYREFFLGNQGNYDNNMFFAETLKQKFNLSESIDEIMQVLSLRNSGESRNVVLTDLKNSWRDLSEIITEKHFDYNKTKRAYYIAKEIDSEYSEAAQKIYEKRKELFYMIINYYTQKMLKKNISFDESLYKLAGFSPCSHCCKE